MPLVTRPTKSAGRSEASTELAVENHVHRSMPAEVSV